MTFIRAYHYSLFKIIGSQSKIYNASAALYYCFVVAFSTTLYFEL